MIPDIKSIFINIYFRYQVRKDLNYDDVMLIKLNTVWKYADLTRETFRKQSRKMHFSKNADDITGCFSVHKTSNFKPHITKDNSSTQDIIWSQ